MGGYLRSGNSFDAPTNMTTAGLQEEVDIANGALPWPETLAQYNAIVPGAAERILRLVEEQAKQRYQLEKAQIEADTWRANVTLGTATGVAALCLLAGVLAILIGESEAVVLGGLIAILGVVLFTGALLYVNRGRRPRPLALPPRGSRGPQPFDL